MTLKPGDTYLIGGRVLMVVHHEDTDKYILVRLVGSTLQGRYRYKEGMIDYLKPFTQLSRGV